MQGIMGDTNTLVDAAQAADERTNIRPRQDVLFICIVLA